jgi:hypothetical protein
MDRVQAELAQDRRELARRVEDARRVSYRGDRRGDYDGRGRSWDDRRDYRYDARDYRR